MQNKDEQLKSLKEIFEIYEWLIKNENDRSAFIKESDAKIHHKNLKRNPHSSFYLSDDLGVYVVKLMEFRKNMQNNLFEEAAINLESFIEQSDLSEDRIYYNLVNTVKEELWYILEKHLKEI